MIVAVLENESRAIRRRFPRAAVQTHTYNIILESSNQTTTTTMHYVIDMRGAKRTAHVTQFDARPSQCGQPLVAVLTQSIRLRR